MYLYRRCKKAYISKRTLNPRFQNIIVYTQIPQKIKSRGRLYTPSPSGTSTCVLCSILTRYNEIPTRYNKITYSLQRYN